VDPGASIRASPGEYFHVVFTVPQEVAAIAYHNKEVVYAILFRAAAQTLRTIAADPKHLGAAIGFFAVLHTWGQNLLHHPHLPCVVPGGGLSVGRYTHRVALSKHRLLDMPPPEPPVPQDYRDRFEQLTGVSLWQCPVCHQGRMVVVEVLPAASRRPAIIDNS
jgi:hypothetical protein